LAANATEPPRPAAPWPGVYADDDLLLAGDVPGDRDDLAS
jgi:hypothetical protein